MATSPPGGVLAAGRYNPRLMQGLCRGRRACLYEQEATRRVLVRKGLLTNEEVLEEIKVVRREVEG